MHHLGRNHMFVQLLSFCYCTTNDTEITSARVPIVQDKESAIPYLQFLYGLQFKKLIRIQ